VRTNHSEKTSVGLRGQPTLLKVVWDITELSLCFIVIVVVYVAFIMFKVWATCVFSALRVQFYGVKSIVGWGCIIHC